MALSLYETEIIRFWCGDAFGWNIAPVGVFWNFSMISSFQLTVTPESIQTITEMSTRNIFLGSKCCWPWSVRPDRPRPTALLPPRSYGKPEAAAAVDRILMMGIRMPETCWTVFKRQALNLYLISASSWLIHLNVLRCTELQTLNSMINRRLHQLRFP